MPKLRAMADEVTIKIRDNGPLLVNGPITLTDADGNPVECGDSNVALCRCGDSAKKPFCDGAHRDSGFDGTLSD